MGTLEATKNKGKLTVDRSGVLITAHGSIWHTVADDVVVGQAGSILTMPGEVLEAEVKQPAPKCLTWSCESLLPGPLQRLDVAADQMCDRSH